jgi:hypothetical protein
VKRALLLLTLFAFSAFEETSGDAPARVVSQCHKCGDGLQPVPGRAEARPHIVPIAPRVLRTTGSSFVVFWSMDDGATYAQHVNVLLGVPALMSPRVKVAAACCRAQCCAWSTKATRRRRRGSGAARAERVDIFLS